MPFWMIDKYWVYVFFVFKIFYVFLFEKKERNNTSYNKDGWWAAGDWGGKEG